MRLEQLASVLAALAAFINVLGFVGPPEHHAQLSVAYNFVFSIYFACIIATGNIIVVMIRAVLAEAERREPSARERLVAGLYSAASGGGGS